MTLMIGPGKYNHLHLIPAPYSHPDSGVAGIDVDTHVRDEFAETAELEKLSPEAESAFLNKATGGRCGTADTGGGCGTVDTGGGCGTVYRGPCYCSGYIRTVEGNITPHAKHTTRATKLLDKYHSENPDFCGYGQGEVREKGGCGREKVREKGGEGERYGRGRKVMAKGGGSEGYEKSQARHGDQTFLKFQKELLHCPQQIIR